MKKKDTKGKAPAALKVVKDGNGNGHDEQGGIDFEAVRVLARIATEFDLAEIEAESEGKIAEILVQNGEHVEYGQHLFRLTRV